MTQLAIKNGNWNSAYLLFPTPDPLQSELFGGDEAEMHQIHWYRRALSDLRAKHIAATTAVEDGKENETEGRAPRANQDRKARGGKKGDGKAAPP